ncbi:MAG TPA: hypothetical protein VFB95_09260 [Candidatus Cryosericum sp.]|nr:hypothetical protein [Candidatus Cryosericum sp.]
MSRIHLVLTDDWELRGNGSGSMPRIQFETMERLVEVYERHGLKASFSVEVMQQLKHLEAGAAEPALLDLARRWEGHVREALRRGHDVQLHVHPQWHGAERRDGRWHLSAAWSILDHPKDRVAAMIRTCREYLEAALRPVDPDYRCVAFRSGSWCLAPGEAILDLLIENGIVFDTSIVQGIHYDRLVRLDYRRLEEPFLPYYPDRRDARRVAADRGPLVCVPTHSFFYRPAAKVRDALARRMARVPGTGHPVAGDDAAWRSPDSVPIPEADTDSYDDWKMGGGGNGGPRGGLRALLHYYLKSTHYVSNLAGLSFVLMREMLRDIRARAAASGWTEVPVVLQNHTKDLGWLDPIERFAALLAASPDIEVITLRELARRLQAGRYPVRFGRAA